MNFVFSPEPPSAEQKDAQRRRKHYNSGIRFWEKQIKRFREGMITMSGRQWESRNGGRCNESNETKWEEMWKIKWIWDDKWSKNENKRAEREGKRRKEEEDERNDASTQRVRRWTRIRNDWYKRREATMRNKRKIRLDRERERATERAIDRESTLSTEDDS